MADDGTKIYEPLTETTAQISTVDTQEIAYGPGDLRDRQRFILSGSQLNSDVVVRSDPPGPADLGAVVRVAGPVTLDAPTLAALEQIVVSGTVALDGPTLAALESITAVVSGSVGVTNLPADYPLPPDQVTTLTPQKNALTDAQLRAAAIPVATGLAQPLTDAQARATPLSVATGLTPLTDAQLRASAVPVATPAGLATNAALVPLLDSVETLLTTLQDTVLRRTDPLPAGTNIIGAVVDRLEARTLLLLPSAARTTGGVSADLATSDLSRAAIDVNVTALDGVAPELRVFLDRMGADGVWYPIWTPAAKTTVGSMSTTVGQGMAVGQSLAAVCRLRWEITGTNPTFTFSVSVVGK